MIRSAGYFFISWATVSFSKDLASWSQFYFDMSSVGRATTWLPGLRDHYPDDDTHGSGRQKVSGVQQRAERAKPVSLGVCDDGRPLLRGHE